MRIISGKYKGKKIDGYEINGTRPTQDRIKESLFAMIQEDIKESTILDLFSGSGNLGIELLSNGSKKAYFVDNSLTAINTINKNLYNLDIKDGQVLYMDYKKALEYFKNTNTIFDIIILDPPYDLKSLDEIINYIIDNNILNSEGIIVCEYEYNQFKESYKNLYLEKNKKYGYKNIRIYRKENNT